MHLAERRYGDVLSALRFQGPPALCALLVIGALSRSALAYHDDKQHVTEDTAYTLPRSDLRLGLWKIDYAPWEHFFVGTYQWPWLLSVANLHAKWRFWEEGDWAFSAASALYHLDTKNLKRVDQSAGNAQIDVVPFELTTSYRFHPKYTLSLSSVFTSVRVKGELTRNVLSGAAEGAVNNFQLVTNLEWRYTHVTAFFATARYLVFQRTTANADVELHPDAFTTVLIRYSGQADGVEFRGAGSLELGAVMSWSTFNLRLGYGYGNYNVPGLNFVTAQKLFFPDFDLFWLF